MQVKGLILSGGSGTRLRPITHTRAKQLVPVAGKPVLFYGLEAMREAGIEDVGIVVGDTHEEIRAAVGDGSRFGLRVKYIHQHAPRGLAHAVLTAEPFLGTSPFVMYLGDNLLRDGITQLVDRFRRARSRTRDPAGEGAEPVQEFGVAELAGERVMRLVEKPKEPQSDLALVGVYLFGPSIFDSARRLSPSPRGELEITDAIQYLIDDGCTVESHVVTGWWKDTGKLEDMLEANRLILDTLVDRRLGEVRDSRIDGRVVIEEGALVERCHVRGPAVIGARAVIRDAYIGPYTALSEDVVVESAELEHAIVMERSRIVGLEARLEDSLIGADVVITRSHGVPRAHRITVGDRARIEIL